MIDHQMLVSSRNSSSLKTEGRRDCQMQTPTTITSSGTQTNQIISRPLNLFHNCNGG